MGLPPRAIALDAHGDESVDQIVFLPDQSTVVTSCRDKTRVFDADTGSLLRILEDFESIPLFCVAVLEDDLVVSGGVGGVITWRPSSAQILHRERLGGESVFVIAPGGPSKFFVGTKSGVLHCFTHVNGKEIAPVHSIENAHVAGIKCIATHGRRLATGSYDRSVKVWNRNTWKQVAKLTCPDETLSPMNIGCLSMDSEHILVGTNRGEVFVWSATTFECLHSLGNWHLGNVRSINLLSDRHILTASTDRRLALTDFRSGDLMHEVELDFHIYDEAITLDGRIATCGSKHGNGSAIIFSAPAPIAKIIRANALSTARYLLGFRGDKSDKNYLANSAQHRWWNSFARCHSQSD